MTAKLSDRERTVLAAIAAGPDGPFRSDALNGMQLRTALRLAGFDASVQGAHQTAASVVRKRLTYKGADARGAVRYGPLTVDGAEALQAATPPVSETSRSFWRLHHNADVGPDSWTGGYDTPEEAREALDFRRAVACQPGSMTRPEEWTVTRTTKIEREDEEPW
jgi:hypothetical protein